MAASLIARNDGIYTGTADSSGPLQAGFVQKAFTSATTQYPSHALTPSLSAHIARSADSLLPLFPNATAALRFSMDRLSAGGALIDLYAQTGEQKYRDAVQVLRDSVDANNRTAEGGLWYYVYPNWSYLDGMHSFGPFWARYALVYGSGGDGEGEGDGDGEVWGELGRQFGLLAERCVFEGGPLLVHGYDYSRTAVWANNTRGQSPHVWGRSLGWYVMGLVDTVDVIDTYGGEVKSKALSGVREWLVEEFRARMEGVVGAVDPATGAWWQVMDQPGREGNYIESSASAMFVYALLAGVRKGYLGGGAGAADARYVDVGRRAYGYLTERFVVDYGNGTLGWNGTVSVCSLNSTASYEYYTSRPILFNSVLGSAAFVAASLEAERLDGW